MAITVVGLATSLQPVAGVEYTVEPGDALWTIAADHEVSMEALVAANRLGDPDLIIAGHTLTIPDAGPAALATYTVMAGDTLWDIAMASGVPLGLLARHNDIGADALIHPGQVLELPTTTSGSDRPDDGSADDDSGLGEPAPAMTSSYEVVEGDSLWGIASRFGVSVDDLMAVNDLERGSVLQVGQNLVVPAADVRDTSSLPADLRSDPDRLALMPIFDRWAGEYRVPPELMKALAWFESGWNNDKRSTADAIGIGQILPITADFVSEVLLEGEYLDPTIIEDNIRLSTRYMRYLLDHAGSVRLAVASYYQGLTATRRHGIYESSVFYVDGILALQSAFT